MEISKVYQKEPRLHPLHRRTMDPLSQEYDPSQSPWSHLSGKAAAEFAGLAPGVGYIIRSLLSKPGVQSAVRGVEDINPESWQGFKGLGAPIPQQLVQQLMQQLAGPQG